MSDEKVLLKIRRQYTESEAVKFIAGKLSEARVEIGILKSEVAELQDAREENEALKKRIANMKAINRKKEFKIADQARDTEYWRNKYLDLKNRR